MNEQNRHGKREAASGRRSLRDYWNQHRSWVAGLSRGQRARYRLFQALVAVCAVIIAVFLALRAWMQMPKIPDLPGGKNPDSSQGEEGPEFDGADLPEVAYSGQRDGVYTFLLVGRDTAGGGNTDTMILFTFDSVNKEIHAISLPRDTMINVGTSSKRLNAVYNYNKGRDPETQVENGMEALKREVSKLTGIVPNYYVMVQWEAIGELVEAIGGVWFEVPFDMDYDDPTPGQDLHIHLKAGYQKLSGDEAMQLVRWRKNNTGSSGGDVARIAIQQDFLKAAIDQCLKPEILLKAPSLVQIFMNNVDTDLSIGNILALAQRAAGVDTEKDVTFVTMPYAEAYYPGVSMVLPVVDELVEVLNDGLNPYEDAIKASDLSVLYRNSDGSYGVTNGALQDSSLARPQVVRPSEPDDEDKEPEDPGAVTDPETPGGQTGTGDSSQSQTGGQSGSQTGGGSQSGEGQTGGQTQPPEEPDQGGGEPVLPGWDDSGQGGDSGDSGQAGGDTPSAGDPGFVDPVLPGDPSDLGYIDPSEVFPAA